MNFSLFLSKKIALIDALKCKVQFHLNIKKLNLLLQWKLPLHTFLLHICKVVSKHKKRSPTVIMVRKSDFGMSYSPTYPLLYTSFTLYARICSFRKCKKRFSGSTTKSPSCISCSYIQNIIN